MTKLGYVGEAGIFDSDGLALYSRLEKGPLTFGEIRRLLDWESAPYLTRRLRSGEEHDFIERFVEKTPKGEIHYFKLTKGGIRVLDKARELGMLIETGEEKAEIELTEEQHRALVRFVYEKAPDILSDEDNLGLLEPLLKLPGVPPTPKDFWVAREKLKEIKTLAEKELPNYVPWHLMGNFSYQLLRIHPRAFTPLDGIVHYRLEAKETKTGFSAGIAAYLEADFIPGTLDALGVTSYAIEPHDKEVPVAHFMYREDVNSLNPKEVLDAIQAYAVAVSALRQPRPVTVEQK